MESIEYLRKKPSSVKQRYAFVIALLLTGGIGAVWLSALPARFAHLDTSSVDRAIVTDSKELSVMQKFVDSVKQQLAALSAARSESAVPEAHEGLVVAPIVGSTTQIVGAGQLEYLGEDVATSTSSSTVTAMSSTTLPETLPFATTTTREPRVILIATTTSE